MTILLDGTVSLDEICNMIDASFLDTASKKKKDKFRQPKEWIVPANPKYYDIEHAFDRLKSDYGIYAVRGPRGIPNSLSAALK